MARSRPRRAVKRPKATKTTRSATRTRSQRPSRAGGPTPGSANDDRRSIPSTLDSERRASAARSGRQELLARVRHHTETGPAFTGGDIDANWEVAYSSGDEAPGGDNPTPDQVAVEEIGRALGIEYRPSEELEGAWKIEERDRHRWELDPASREDAPRRRQRPREDEGDERGRRRTGARKK